MNQSTPVDLTPWKEYEKILFRFFFIYFLIQVLPLDWSYLANLFSFGWLGLHYGDIFHLTRYSPKLFTADDSFYNWAIAALVALIGVAVWTVADQRSKEYNKLYFWLRVLVRYRLAIGIIGYGMIKLFPLQAPFPSISNLNTHYGDLSSWKIFSMSLGIVPGYQSFLGLVEIVAGLLLLYRKTATIGAFIIAIFTGNVFMSNLAYEGGEHVYSLYLISLALFILAYDAIGLYRLFGEEKAVVPKRYNPVFTAAWQQTGRYAAKAAFLLFFVVVYGFTTYSGAREDRYQFPNTPGLAGAAGIYDVAEFSINNQVLPHSATDPVRWKDVVFEEWATISIRSNRPVSLEHALVEQVAAKDEERIYELAGSAGRHYYQYSIDTQQNKLLLQNKNINYAGEKLVFQFTRTSKDQIVLNGVSERNDSLHVVLNRIPKKYLLIEAEKGRNKPIKL
ncbi:DoxX family protein [Paracnuella aquatica]|uniref:DoxX family protein n=1 Tax=Paracnuella aquatica TaxID=2268757 RepID=UPI000DEF8E1A|nr:DoxX family protein [Paracnuella aquatica]RPD47291.1 DoxX family protein [Paracnuella aquatica]